MHQENAGHSLHAFITKGHGFAIALQQLHKAFASGTMFALGDDCNVEAYFNNSLKAKMNLSGSPVLKLHPFSLSLAAASPESWE